MVVAIDRSDDLGSLLITPVAGTDGKPKRRRRKGVLDRRVGVLARSLRELERRLVEVGCDYATPNRRMRDVDRDYLEDRVASFVVDFQTVLKDIGWDDDKGLTVFERSVRATLLQRMQDLAAAFRELQQLRSRRDALRQPRLWVAEKTDPWKFHKQNVKVASATIVKKVPVLPFEERPKQEDDRQMQALLQEERQMLSAEIHHGEYDAAQKVEARMHQVSQLISTFTALTTEQHETVNTLFDTIHHAADDIDKGRDQVHRTMQRKESFPDVFVAIVLSLTVALLLLHWMSP